MHKAKIAVLFGGVSSEHDVSLLSAKSVIENIPEDKYEVIKIGITRDGSWLLFTGDTSELENGSWERNPSNRSAFIAPDTGIHGIIAANANGTCETIRLDAVFPVLHGKNGEDGTMQGLLTMAGIPFVGCGCAASAVCMDKMIQKCMCSEGGIGQAKWTYAYASDCKDDSTVLTAVEEKLGYPIFVKPANAGSSVGITKAHNHEELETAVALAAEHDSKVVFEENVDGYEIECAVLGNEVTEVSCCGEIVPCNEFYDYDAKYLAGKTNLRIPAPLEQQKADEVRAVAKLAYRLLGCAGLTRMDFFVRKSDGAVLLNEPNTIPGFTSISMYPKLFDAVGIPYGELLDRLIQLAIEAKR